MIFLYSENPEPQFRKGCLVISSFESLGSANAPWEQIC